MSTKKTKPGETDLAILLDRLVRRIHLRLHEAAQEFDTARVGPGGAMILLTLSETGCMAMSDLTHRLMRDKSQMTRAITALETKRMVTRTPSDSDARVTMVALTDAGWAMVGAHQQALAAILDDLLEPLPPGGKSTMRGLLYSAVGDGAPGCDAGAAATRLAQPD